MKFDSDTYDFSVEKYVFEVDVKKRLTEEVRAVVERVGQALSDEGIYSSTSPWSLKNTVLTILN